MCTRLSLAPENQIFIFQKFPGESIALILGYRSEQIVLSAESKSLMEKSLKSFYQARSDSDWTGAIEALSQCRYRWAIISVLYKAICSRPTSAYHLDCDVRLNLRLSSWWTRPSTRPSRNFLHLYPHYKD